MEAPPLPWNQHHSTPAVPHPPRKVVAAVGAGAPHFPSSKQQRCSASVGSPLTPRLCPKKSVLQMPEPLVWTGLLGKVCPVLVLQWVTVGTCIRSSCLD